jgi:hypothetical protein
VTVNEDIGIRSAILIIVICFIAIKFETGQIRQVFVKQFFPLILSQRYYRFLRYFSRNVKRRPVEFELKELPVFFYDNAEHRSGKETLQRSKHHDARYDQRGETPPAQSSPALSAFWWPKLRESEM